MHPNRTFAWEDRDAMLAFIAERSFCTLCLQTAEGPILAYAPVLVAAGNGQLRFHLSRANAAAKAEPTRALISCVGPDAYVSPDWYGSPDTVPTWNYVAVECEGSLRRLSEAELTILLDDLSAVHEARLAPKPPWTRAKMSQGRFEAAAEAILGYELRIDALRGTRKLSQNRSADDREQVLAGLVDAGSEAMAALMRGEEQ